MVLDVDEAVISDDVMRHYLNGLAFEGTRRFDLAVREFEQAINVGGSDPAIYVSLARCYLELDEHARAEEVVLAGLERSPGDGDLHEVLAGIQLGRGEWESGIRELEAARDAAPDDFGIRYQLGVLYHRAGRDSAAIVEFREAARHVPPTGEGAGPLAAQLEQAGDTESAAELFGGMLAADSSSVTALAGLARIAERNGDLATAVAHLERASLVNPGRYEILKEIFRLRGAAMVEGGDAEPVLEAGRRVLEVAPDDGECALAMAAILAQRGDLSGARSLLEAVPDASQQAPAVHLLLGRLCWAMGDEKRSLEALEKARMLAPEWVAPLAPLGLVLLEKGEPERADSLLSAAHTALPDDPEVAFLAGAAKSRMARYEEAATLFARSLELRNGDARVLFEYGVVLEKLGRVEDSARAFEELLSKEPGNSLAHNYLGFMLADRGLRLDDSERHIRSAVEADPANGYYVDSLGWVRYRKGDLEGATEILEHAASLVESGEIRAHLAEVYEKRDMLTEARRNWRKAVTLEPDNAAWRARLDALSKD